MGRTYEQWMSIIAKMPVEGPGIRGVEFLSSGELTWKNIERYIKRSEISNVIDIGCGHGRMAVSLVDSDTQYLGIDIIPKMITWADDAFKPWNNIQFTLANIYNGMYNRNGITPLKFQLDAKDRSIDLVLALSLFTHIESISAVRRYLLEVRRVLHKSGTCICSWFKSPPNELSASPRRTVFAEEEIFSTIADVGFKVLAAYGGTTVEWHDQMTVVLENG